MHSSPPASYSHPGDVATLNLSATCPAAVRHRGLRGAAAGPGGAGRALRGPGRAAPGDGHAPPRPPQRALSTQGGASVRELAFSKCLGCVCDPPQGVGSDILKAESGYNNGWGSKQSPDGPAVHICWLLRFSLSSGCCEFDVSECRGTCALGSKVYPVGKNNHLLG